MNTGEVISKMIVLGEGLVALRAFEWLHALVNTPKRKVVNGWGQVEKRRRVHMFGEFAGMAKLYVALFTASRCGRDLERSRLVALLGLRAWPPRPCLLLRRSRKNAIRLGNSKSLDSLCAALNVL